MRKIIDSVVRLKKGIRSVYNPRRNKDGAHPKLVAPYRPRAVQNKYMTSQQDTRTVDERVAGLEGEVGHLSNQLTELGRAVTKGFERLSSNSKTQWNPLIAAGAVALAVGGSFFALIKADLARLESQAASNALVASTLVRDVDAALQREMRDLDRVAATALKSQRELLQAEMGWIKDGLNTAESHTMKSEIRTAELEAQLRETHALVTLLMSGKVHTNAE